MPGIGGNRIYMKKENLVFGVGGIGWPSIYSHSQGGSIMSENRHWTPERSELIKAYPGRKWYKKVLEMDDQQVHEAWISVRNRLEKKKKSAQI